MDPRVFNVGKWHGKLLFTPGAYEQLVSMATNPKSVREFKSSIVFQRCSEEGELIDSPPSPRLEQAREELYEDVLASVDHYASLMVVTAATYIENILIEFFTAFFSERPSSMKPFLAASGQQDRPTAGISLEDVLSSNDMQEFRKKLAKRSAKIVCNGPIIKVCERLSRVTGKSLTHSTIQALITINDMRNAVVHEGYTYDEGEANVAARFGDVLELLKEIAQVCAECGIPCSDDGRLVSEWPIPEPWGDEA